MLKNDSKWIKIISTATDSKNIIFLDSLWGGFYEIP